MTTSDARVDFGYRSLRMHGRLLSGRIGVRLVVTTAAFSSLAVAMAFWAMFFGDYPLTAGDVAASLLGTSDAFTARVVLEWRLPVVVAAVVFGAMLGIGGAIFQSLTRNPLGSPDVIGFDAGAYTAVVIVMLVLGVQRYWTIAAASIVGGLLTALAVYLLAHRRGVQGFRLIVVGIAVASLLVSINTYLITRADIDDAMQVGVWGAGTLSRVSWTTLTPSLAIAVGIAALCVVLSSGLRTLELGDDAAATQGTRVGVSRIALLTTGVATTALVTAAAGPIGFIALAAPQLARRVARTQGVSLLASAAMGAALLSAAHLLAQQISSLFRPLPVGLVTICLGGVYLILLLVRESRAQSGAPR